MLCSFFPIYQKCHPELRLILFILSRSTKDFEIFIFMLSLISPILGVWVPILQMIVFITHVIKYSNLAYNSIFYQRLWKITGLLIYVMAPTISSLNGTSVFSTTTTYYIHSTYYLPYAFTLPLNRRLHSTQPSN